MAFKLGRCHHVLGVYRGVGIADALLETQATPEAGIGAG
jgi:hypothetical protein